ncbi:hypothetical protein GCM10022232_13840 [Streptomyces plumbiresistens]|uniref:Uncharacterized protein n=1 Tax=Streptomyces plumbiresistens TaxID=511811 RepID=A0ABP7QIL1_9ACTN
MPRVGRVGVQRVVRGHQPGDVDKVLGTRRPTRSFMLHVRSSAWLAPSLDVLSFLVTVRVCEGPAAVRYSERVARTSRDVRRRRPSR